jgi:glycosyltransferase involved in cell wall biosynthesis
MRCIDTVRPDIVFSQVFPANWWGFIAKLVRGRSLCHIWMCQEPSAFIHSKRWIDSLPYNLTGLAARIGNPVLKALDVRLAQKVDHVFANSQFSRQLAFAAYGYKPEQVSICYPGVDVYRFAPSSEIARTHYKFITCARLTTFKNIDRIIKALTYIADPRVTLTVIGRGEEYDSLVRLAHSLHLDNRVTFLQTVSDSQMIEELRSSYGLIHAAEEEPFGLTPVEAMACGTPVIAMQGGGPAETVVHESTGYLCSQAHEETIVHAINWLIAQEQRFAAMSAACVVRAQQFTWELAATSLEKVFVAQRHSI